MGTETDLTGADVRWLSPLPLWAGTLAGPVAWAVDLAASYALVTWSCGARREDVLHGLTLAALAVTAAGATVCWAAVRQTRDQDGQDDGDHPRQRARFMAIVGLTASALFAVAIVAAAIPVWVFDACH